MDFQHALDEFILYIEIERNYSPSTIKGYQDDLTHFLIFLRGSDRSTELNEITNTFIRRYIQYLVKMMGLKPRTIQRRIAAINSFVKFCSKENWLKEKFGLRNEAMFKLIATTGMRRQEIVDLTFDQVDLTAEIIRVSGKGSKERLIPLHPLLISLLVAYVNSLQECQRHHSQPLFLNKNGQKMDPRGLHKLFKELIGSAGLPPSRFTLHHLRHTFATLMLQENKKNIDLRILQELLGHTTIASTQVYTHVDFAQKRKAIATFDIL